MKSRKRTISNRVLQTELSMMIHLIDDMNFGYLRSLVEDVLDRVKEYDLSTEGAKNAGTDTAK